MRSAETTEGSKPKAVEAKVNIDEAKWGEDDDSLGSLDDDINAEGSAAAAAVDGNDGTTVGQDAVESDIFVPPAPGADPYQTILRQNPTNVALNAASGEFQKAIELLQNQISVSNFAPLKQLFVDAHTLNRVKLQTLPHAPHFDLQLKTTATLPLLPVSITNLEERMAKGIDCTTKGDFVQSLATFRGLI